MAATCTTVLASRVSIARPQAASRPILAAPVAQRRLVSKANTRFVVRAETRETTPNQEANQVDVEKVVKDLQEKWDQVDNKTGVIVYGSGAIIALWLASTIVGALNNIPLLPKLFELVGLGYSAWFTYRYLLFKSSREELIEDIEALKKKIGGEQ